MSAGGISSTSWVVITGDTGWRYFDIGSGWTAVRRINSRVEFVLSGNIGSVNMDSLPWFMPANQINFDSGGNSLSITGPRFAISGNSQWNSEFTFLTDDTWPTALPGSPA